MRHARRFGVVCGLLALSVVWVGSASTPAGAQRADSTPCAYRDGPPALNGRTATEKFHVVADGCQVSFVSITILSDGDTIFDTDTGIYPASDQDVSQSVEMPCDHGSETDLVLGPPTLYPPSEFDLGAFRFDLSCSSTGGSTGGGSGGGGSGGGGGGGASGGGGGSSQLPDLGVSVASALKTLALGTHGTATVTVKNKGAGAAGGVHVLISTSNNAIVSGGHTSRGPGCTGVSFLDCNLGSLGSGATATVKVTVSGVRGKKLFIGAQAQEAQNDSHLADNIGALVIGLTPHVTRLTLKVRPTTFSAGEQLAYVSLSKRASLVAHVFVGGAARPVTWRRTFPAGTFIVRIPVTGVTKGQRFRLVVDAKNGLQTSKASLRLKA